MYNYERMSSCDFSVSVDYLERKEGSYTIRGGEKNLKLFCADVLIIFFSFLLQVTQPNCTLNSYRYSFVNKLECGKTH